ncbi:expressed unknown protein [Seminavis robusta]|uniref:Uncharacterized protein n=1 Tax=Seminavis robusta TaxID=568900 RepID=A0A9N8EE17_9STRA|nr:expressed unknown protein [Seminavis robusta]|eukprot:Sro806_g205090.1 n/a (542) ;mRNA; r:16575-18200
MSSVAIRIGRLRSTRGSISTLKRPRSATFGPHCFGGFQLDHYAAGCTTSPLLSRSASSGTSKSTPTASNEVSQIRPIFDTSLNWEDWFSPEEYGDPWAFPDREETNHTSPNPETQSASSSRKQTWQLEPLHGDNSLDSQSRYLIRLLQTVYQHGYAAEEEVTAARCLFMIGQLLAKAEQISRDPQYKGVGDSGATLIRQRVMRAEAILRTMELFWDYIPDLLEEDQVTATYNYEPRNRRSVAHWNNHKPIVKWPVPTYEIYVLVSRALATLMRFPKQYQQTVKNDDTAWISQDVVLRLHLFHKTKGLVFLDKPPVAGFNQVLLAWANAHGDRDHPQKALHATQFFMDMKLIYNVVPDASAYSHVLRACAHPDGNEIAKELGVKLALKFWNGVLRDELKEHSFEPTPFLFAFCLRALSGLKEYVPSEEESAVLTQVWEEACRYGMVNEYVLYELEQASRPLFRDLLNSYRDKVDTHKLKPYLKESYDKSYHRELMQFLPTEWMEKSSSQPVSREERINDAIKAEDGGDDYQELIDLDKIHLN